MTTRTKLWVAVGLLGAVDVVLWWAAITRAADERGPWMGAAAGLAGAVIAAAFGLATKKIDRDAGRQAAVEAAIDRLAEAATAMRHDMHDAIASGGDEALAEKAKRSGLDYEVAHVKLSRLVPRSSEVWQDALRLHETLGYEEPERFLAARDKLIGRRPSRTGS